MAVQREERPKYDSEVKAIKRDPNFQYVIVQNSKDEIDAGNDQVENYLNMGFVVCEDETEGLPKGSTLYLMKKPIADIQKEHDKNNKVWKKLLTSGYEDGTVYEVSEETGQKINGAKTPQDLNG